VIVPLPDGAPCGVVLGAGTHDITAWLAYTPPETERAALGGQQQCTAALLRVLHTAVDVLHGAQLSQQIQQPAGMVTHHVRLAVPSDATPSKVLRALCGADESADGWPPGEGNMRAVCLDATLRVLSTRNCVAHVALTAPAGSHAVPLVRILYAGSANTQSGATDAATSTLQAREALLLRTMQRWQGSGSPAMQRQSEARTDGRQLAQRDALRAKVMACQVRVCVCGVFTPCVATRLILLMSCRTCLMLRPGCAHKRCFLGHPNLRGWRRVRLLTPQLLRRTQTLCTATPLCVAAQMQMRWSAADAMTSEKRPVRKEPPTSY
jgi:hypothetical protein